MVTWNCACKAASNLFKLCYIYTSEESLIDSNFKLERGTSEAEFSILQCYL